MHQNLLSHHNKKEGFFIKGRAEDVNTVMKKARVLLAPLRFGAGLKGKLVDAMLNGTPSVTTNTGSEGMNAEFEWPGEITNDPKSFADSAIRLYSEESSWKKAQEKCLVIINERFSKDKYTKIFTDIFEKIQSDLKNHRENNFIGAMLMHHTISASRYMALWIEQKNNSQRAI